MANILNSLSRVKQGDVVLSVRDIKKTFIEGGQPLHILRGGGFDLHRGEIIALVGQSGSGKSTLLQCVGLLDKPSAGSIMIGGAAVQKMDEDMRTKMRRNKIGFVLQKAVLFKGTIRENIKWGNNNATDDEILKALKDAQCLDIIKQKENGLDEIIEQIPTTKDKEKNKKSKMYGIFVYRDNGEVQLTPTTSQNLINKIINFF